jgi:hypothetical protein
VDGIVKNPETKRRRYDLIRSQLELELSSYKSLYRDLGDYIAPRRVRLNITDANRGDKRALKIIDNTASDAQRTLQSGMMAGMTSPARPWHRLTTPDPDLAEFGHVKEWLHKTTQRQSTVFLRSNVYNTLPILYGDTGTFGTAAMLVEEDLETVIRTYSFPIGSFRAGKDHRGRICTFSRDWRMTVRQVVEQFGQRDPRTGAAKWDNISTYVKNMWDRSMYEAWVDVSLMITPNEDYNPRSPWSKHKAFASCYFELGTSSGNNTSYLQSATDTGIFLSERGYDYFPVLMPRWEVTGEDVYGTNCPGMMCLGDVKQLQHGEKMSAEAITKMVRPPMVGPTSMRNSKSSILPGDMTFADIREGTQGFRPAHEVRLSVSELEEKQQQCRGRINRAYFSDLFLMLSNDQRNERPTAYEVSQLREERLLAVGPVLEQFNEDCLNGLIDISFALMVKQGKIPMAPPELHGQQLKVDYISIMAQAQKAIGISSLERFSGFLGQLMPNFPEVRNKVVPYQLVNEYADGVGVSPRVIRPDDDAQAMQAQQERAQQAAAMSQQIKDGAGAARDLSQADMTRDSALSRLLEQAQAGQVVPQ